MRCTTAREEFTALADGALPPEEAERVRAHVDSCRACVAELAMIERTVALERMVLSQPLPDLSLGFETRLKQRLVQVSTEGRHWWQAWWWRPLAIGSLAVASILLAAAPLGGPSAVLVPLGIQPPPPKVAKEPELFTDYAIIEHLDELEHFDTVETMPLDDNKTGTSKGSA